jgi:uncharacterized protein
MRWEDYRQSDNVEDRRGEGGYGGGGFQLPMGGGGLGIGGMILVGIVAWALGINPSVLIGSIDQILDHPQYQQDPRVPPRQPQAKRGPPQDQQGRFVATVLAQTEDVWRVLFTARGQRYEEPRLVIFERTTQSACGFAQAAMGPFYCPPDRRVYLDLSFFRDLRERFRAPGDFAAAYVIAHEVGHHVQNLLGIMSRIDRDKRGASKAQGNAISVRMELQADCLAGVWAYHANANHRILQEGDVEAAMRAAAAVGDDRLQQARGGAVVPESFTHGSSKQRTSWFMTGLKSGTLDRCNTFAPGAVSAN